MLTQKSYSAPTVRIHTCEILSMPPPTHPHGAEDDQACQSSLLLPTMPPTFSYSQGTPFVVTLRAREENRHFEIPVERMQRIAHHASMLRKYEVGL